MGRLMKKIKNKQYGQAMAEFALTLPIFLLLVFGIIELSRFFLTYSSVFTATREASRYGSTAGAFQTEINGSTKEIHHFQDCEGIKETAVRMGSFAGINENNVTITYETKPGVPDPAPVCDMNNPYQGKLGDRVKVSVTTTYQPILGLVPPISISSENGRTIMMAITVLKTPEPIDLCDDFVSYVDDDIQEGDDEILFVEIGNSSSQSSFKIFRIENINWVVIDDAPKLMEIRWGEDEDPIWIKDLEEGRLPIITIPDEGSIDYWKEHTRTLGTGETKKLEFVFSESVDQEDIGLSFDVILQNAHLDTDFCYPVE